MINSMTDQVKIGSSFHFGNKSFMLFPFIYDLVSLEVSTKASEIFTAIISLHMSFLIAFLITFN